MFSSLGWGEMLILAFAGLIILGPERLPGAIQWSFKTLRQVREYATGATDQLKEEFGDDFDGFKEFQEPLRELNNLRGMSPRAAITKHLLDGDDSFLTGNFDKPAPAVPQPEAPSLKKAVDLPTTAAAPDAHPAAPKTWNFDDAT